MATRAYEAVACTDEEKRFILHDAIWYEILYAFGVPDHDDTDYSQWEAINFNRMGHARVLYDFLEKTPNDRNQHRTDDVLAADYDFPAKSINRPTDDRERLNKDLFHLTYARLRHTANTKPWPDSILLNLFDRCVEFMEYVRSRSDFFDTDDQRAKWTTLLDLLKSGRELRIRGVVRPDSTACYTLGLGDRLPSGKPVLTKLRPAEWIAIV